MRLMLCAVWQSETLSVLCICMSCVSLVEYIAQYKAYIMEFLQTWNTDCFTYRHIFMYRQTCMERKYASSIQIYLWVCHLVWHFIIGYCECEAVHWEVCCACGMFYTYIGIARWCAQGQEERNSVGSLHNEPRNVKTMNNALLYKNKKGSLYITYIVIMRALW